MHACVHTFWHHPGSGTIMLAKPSKVTSVGGSTDQRTVPRSALLSRNHSLGEEF